MLREAERAVGAADTPTRRRLAVRDWALVVFLLNTGLRIAEVCALMLEDVQLGERSGWVVVRGGKGNKNRRVPLNAEVRRALRAWLDERGEVMGSVFDLTPSGAYRRLAEMGRRAGIAVHPHTLRHTLAKNLVDAGVGLHEVAALLGHSSLNTTRVYVTPGERDLERAMRMLEG
ncbi:tyrosine-type recombinase/integrase [Anaerolinea sp.]|uniref:tyrosine-type recombinase/integrase n=1 Tax=Anaerolinea sp. TaxID=1872519 RepID=UPI002ACE0451|nr:tyrosine-type recombinase/integrase [Anaerolinea sp.]